MLLVPSTSNNIIFVPTSRRSVQTPDITVPNTALPFFSSTNSEHKPQFRRTPPGWCPPRLRYRDCLSRRRKRNRPEPKTASSGPHILRPAVQSRRSKHRDRSTHTWTDRSPKLSTSRLQHTAGVARSTRSPNRLLDHPLGQRNSRTGRPTQYCSRNTYNTTHINIA